MVTPAHCSQGHEWDDPDQPVCPVCGSNQEEASAPDQAANDTSLPESPCSPVFHEVLQAVDNEKRPLTPALIAITGMLAGVLLFWFAFLRPDPPQRTERSVELQPPGENPAIIPKRRTDTKPAGRPWSLDLLDPARTTRNPLGYREMVAVVGTALPEHTKLIRAGAFPSGTGAKLAFTPDGRFLVCVDHVSYLRAWDITTRKELACVKVNAPTLSVAVTPDGQVAAAGSQVWDLSARKIIRDLRESGLPVHAVAFARDASLLALGFGDSKSQFSGSVSVWNCDTGEEQRSFTCQAAVQFLAFSPDGQDLAVGGWNGSVTLWNLTAKKQRYVRYMDGAVNCLAFSRYGSTVVAGDSRGQLRKWETGTGAETRFQFGHENPVVSVGYSDDGKILSVETGGRAILWDAETGDQLRDWPSFRFGHGAVVAPDGRHLAVASVDGTVSILRLVTKR